MNSSIKSLNNNKKKITYSKNKKIYPELIPIGTKSNSKVSSPVLPVIQQQAEPEMLIFHHEPKLDHVCKNHTCQNIKIKNDEIGEGYCSSKCAVEHSNTVFQHWLFSEKYPDALPKPDEGKVGQDCNLEGNKLNLFITSKIPVTIPNIENNNNVNHTTTKVSEPSLPSPTSSVKTQSEATHDDLEISEARQPLFQKLFFENFSNIIPNQMKTKSNSVKSTKHNINTAQSQPIEDDNSDIEIISVHTPRDSNQNRKRKLMRPKLVAKPKVKETIFIEID